MIPEQLRLQPLTGTAGTLSAGVDVVIPRIASTPHGYSWNHAGIARHSIGTVGLWPVCSIDRQSRLLAGGSTESG